MTDAHKCDACGKFFTLEGGRIERFHPILMTERPYYDLCKDCFIKALKAVDVK